MNGLIDARWVKEKAWRFLYYHQIDYQPNDERGEAQSNERYGGNERQKLSGFTKMTLVNRRHFLVKYIELGPVAQRESV